MAAVRRDCAIRSPCRHCRAGMFLNALSEANQGLHNSWGSRHSVRSQVLRAELRTLHKEAEPNNVATSGQSNGRIADRV